MGIMQRLLKILKIENDNSEKMHEVSPSDEENRYDAICLISDDDLYDSKNIDIYTKENVNLSSNSNEEKEKTGISKNRPLKIIELLAIKKYWSTFSYDRSLMNYRQPSASEMKEYAKANVISAFETARSNDNFSVFFLGQINVTNWYVFFDELLRNGYIRRANSKEILASYTLKDLKIIAESIGTKKTGRKADLIERICESVPSNELNDMMDMMDEEILFIASEKGRQYLSLNNDFAMLRRHAICQVSLSEYIDNRFIGGVKRNFYDTMFQALSTQKRYYSMNKNYSSMSLVCLHIYNIMLEEYERTERNVPIDVMLLNYMEHLYLKTCLVYEAESLSEGVRPYYNNILYIHMPHINVSLSKFNDCKDLINFKAVFSDKPPSFLGKECFIAFITEFFNTSMFNYSKWDEILQDNFQKYMKLFKI